MPNALLTEILSFLPVEELMSTAALVSTRFYVVSHSPTLFRNVTLDSGASPQAVKLLQEKKEAIERLTVRNMPAEDGEYAGWSSLQWQKTSV